MMTIGELLKYKASQKVRVLLHVWDEALSVNTPLFSTAGVMCTYDEETRGCLGPCQYASRDSTEGTGHSLGSRGSRSTSKAQGWSATSPTVQGLLATIISFGLIIKSPSSWMRQQSK